MNSTNLPFSSWSEPMLYLRRGLTKTPSHMHDDRLAYYAEQIFHLFNRWMALQECKLEQINLCSDYITKHDLRVTEERLTMLQSEAKALIATAAAQNKEALGEIKARLTSLQQKIDDLIAGAGDPEITDEAYLVSLNALRTDAEALANLVPGALPLPTPDLPGRPTTPVYPPKVDEPVAFDNPKPFVSKHHTKP